MKLKLISALIGIPSIMVVYGCNKCSTCTKPDASTVNYCESDFDSQIKYDLALRDLADEGYTCRED